jgi:alpha-galactosidase
MTAPEYVTLDAGEGSIVFSCKSGERPAIIYWGARLKNSQPDTLELMATRQHAPGGTDIDRAPSLLNETGSGISGMSGFAAHRDGRDWASQFIVTEVKQPTLNSLEIICEDEVTQLKATHIIALDPDSAIMTAATEIENLGDTPLSLDWCAALVLPLDQELQNLRGFTGRWANEFQIEDIPAFTGAYVRESKAGRTSHDSFPALIAATPHTNEQSGTCYGYHLGWSGNHRLRVDRLADGRAFVQMGELFFPGEMTVAPNGTYRTPILYAAYSNDGFSALSRQFQTHVQSNILDGRTQRKPRPIHYNTWEAVYFDHNADRLFALADKAAEVGAERFILDDGWFGSRRSDKTGLGDWVVSDEAYPDGLKPLIDKVTGLGMEFGLWFEPEMVNPDSDLYRAHPDWVLQAPGMPQIRSRSQYVLDLTRREVSEYLFDKMHALLSTYDISYIKWDMNRDIHHPGNAHGRPVTSAQTHAVYALMDRIRAAHPDLEIESCASGGGRADYGVLGRTDRIWTSDSNDALNRQIIQRGASHFFPLAIMGAHVGPAKCHITGRRLSMKLRVATAMFGHMGMELNLLDEDARDLETLKQGLALHKQHRSLIHSGDFHRLDTPDYVNAIGVVAADKTEALYSWCNLRGHSTTLPGRMRVAGLDPARQYRTRIVWPSEARSVSKPSVIDALDLAGSGAVLSGEALMKMGLQVPLLQPETGLIYRFEAI